MADLLNIGLSGLSANKTSLAITGHNITNVNTPGFSRQETIQATRAPQFSGAGYIGSGTTLVDVRRIYNEFLNTQVRSSTALDSDAQAYLGQINQLDSLLAGTTTGINPGLQKVFAALQAANAPSRLTRRRASRPGSPSTPEYGAARGDWSAKPHKHRVPAPGIQSRSPRGAHRQDSGQR